MNSPEKRSSAESESTGVSVVKLDHENLPLIPQPLDDPEDVGTPLNWSRGEKYVLVAIASLTAFIGTFAIAGSDPVLHKLENLWGLRHRCVVHWYMTQCTVGIAASSIGSFIWAARNNVYCRRPVFVFAQTMAVGAGFGAANLTSNAMSEAPRCCSTWGIHRSGRGLAMDKNTPVYHECCVPGPHRPLSGLPFIKSNGKYHRLRLTGTRAVGRKLQLIDFAQLFRVVKYILPRRGAWVVCSCRVHARRASHIISVHPAPNHHCEINSIMPAQTVSALFRTYYKWGSARTGVALSMSTTTGGLLGELVSGPVIDELMERSRKHEGHIARNVAGNISPPHRGLLMFGFSIMNHELEQSYIGATVGIAVTSKSSPHAAAGH
ncbi:hypothetical protein DFH06DRAFT_1123947 [Mycena polygramma]|nr:hypothetical protein DFH06DRAFT_1123947 [Mycena polygramma]